MRKNLSLVLSVMMFMLTTTLLIMVPITIKHKMDFAQIGLLVMLAFMGYFAALLLFYTHRDNRR